MSRKPKKRSKRQRNLKVSKNQNPVQSVQNPDQAASSTLQEQETQQNEIDIETLEAAENYRKLQLITAHHDIPLDKIMGLKMPKNQSDADEDEEFKNSALYEVLHSPWVTKKNFDKDPRIDKRTYEERCIDADIKSKIEQAFESVQGDSSAQNGENKPFNPAEISQDEADRILSQCRRKNQSTALNDPGNKTCEEYEKELENFEFISMNEALEQVDEDASKPLLGPLMHQGDVVGLVAESNVGKTILAVQLAEYWTSGRFGLPGLENHAGPQKVAFLSAEMSDAQMKRRYTSPTGETFKFSPDLIYVDKNLENEEKMKAMVKLVVKKAQPTIIIIDSLCQVADSDMTKMTQVKPLIKYFKEIAKEHKVTFLIILHTKKRSAVDRKKDKMDKYSLYGSSAITNMFDALWALDQSLRENLKILTQVKSRDGDLVYNNENALIMSIVKDEPDNFLRFEVERVAAIGNLLSEKKSSESDPQTDRQKAIVFKCWQNGIIRQPSLLRKYFGLTAGSSCRWIEALNNGCALNFDYMLNETDLQSIKNAENEVTAMRMEKVKQLQIF